MKFKKRPLTKRAIIYVGYRCSAHCIFCYYKHKKYKTWRPIAELKQEVARYRFFYRCEAIDISGGEPTEYPDILELLSYCRLIGIVPTIITNGFRLADAATCARFKAHGVDVFLVSFFGLGKSAQEVTGIDDAAKKQQRAIAHLEKQAIDFRFNVTVHRKTVPQLVDIATFFMQTSARDISFMLFNPFNEWQEKAHIEFQVPFSAISEEMRVAMYLLVGARKTVRVRYFPFCVLRGYEKHVYNFMQLPYDRNEWDFNVWNDYFLMKPNKKWFEKEAIRKRQYEAKYVKSEQCDTCSLRYICDGMTSQYVKRFGFGEERPYDLGRFIKEPAYFLDVEEAAGDHGSIPHMSRFAYICEEPSSVPRIANGWRRYVRDRKNYYYNRYVKKYF